VKAFGGFGKDPEVRIAGTPGLIDALKIISGANQVKDEKDNSYSAKIIFNVATLSSST